MTGTDAAPQVLTFTPRDDRFHFDELGSDRWATETAWFSFVVPERKLGGWLYSMVRPNIDSVAGGVWVWDDSGVTPWEVLYSRNLSVMPFDRTQDLDRIDLSNGVSITATDPGTSYDVGFDDPGLLSVNLRFTGVMAPFGVAGWMLGSNFDQFGRVTGQIDIRGEKIDVDCLAIRNRTWGSRREDSFSRHIAYVSGIADEQTGFLAVCDVDNDDAPLWGFLLRNGEAAPVASSRRKVRLDPRKGWVDTIRLELTDTQGRSLVATGRAVSRIIIDRRSGIDCNSLIEWSFDGFDSAWGEDQNCVPMHAWPTRGQVTS
jgi:hypothetical protein